MHPVLIGFSFGGFRKVEKQQAQKQQPEKSELELKKEAYEKMISDLNTEINAERFCEILNRSKDDIKIEVYIEGCSRFYCFSKAKLREIFQK